MQLMNHKFISPIWRVRRLGLIIAAACASTAGAQAPVQGTSVISGQPCELGHRDQVAAQVEAVRGRVFDAVWVTDKQYYLVTLDKGQINLTVRLDPSFHRITSIGPWPPPEDGSGTGTFEIRPCVRERPYAWRAAKPGAVQVLPGAHEHSRSEVPPK